MNETRGTIEIHLKELLEEAGLSKNKFCQRAECNVHNYVPHFSMLLSVEFISTILALACSLCSALTALGLR